MSGQSRPCRVSRRSKSWVLTSSRGGITGYEEPNFDSGIKPKLDRGIGPCSNPACTLSVRLALSPLLTYPDQHRSRAQSPGRQTAVQGLRPLLSPRGLRDSASRTKKANRYDEETLKRGRGAETVGESDRVASGRGRSEGRRDGSWMGWSAIGNWR